MKHIGKAIVALAAAIGMALSGGVAAANADDYDFPTWNYDVKSSVSNVKVSEIGAHTANVTFDWKIDAPADQIKSVCAVATVDRIIDITPIENQDSDYVFDGTYDDDCSTGTKDTELTTELYNRYYSIHERDLTLPTADSSGEYTAAKYTGQDFMRWNDGVVDGKSNSGTFSLSIIGLTPNTTYGNTAAPDGYSFPALTGGLISNKFEALWKEGARTKTAVDIRQTVIGLHIVMKDGSIIPIQSNAAKVPDFTTTAEPAGTPESALTDETKDNITTDNGGTVTAGKSARIYINDLKEDCKGDKACFWYGYIYSTPTKLTDPMGSPFLTVQKDDAGKYYVDAHIPDGLTGEHKIALTDEAGKLQGWTQVTVSKDGQTTPDKPDQPEATKVPVYRLYNPYMTSGTTHLFTTDKAEYDKAVAAGWTGEGVKFYAAASDKDGAKPVYRLYNKYDGSHHFTVDPGEKDLLVKAGWELEKTTWWAPADGNAKIYRLYNQYNGEHLFTTDKGENDHLAGVGWTEEDAGFSVYSEAK